MTGENINRISLWVETILKGFSGFADWLFSPLSWLEPILGDLGTPATLLTMGGIVAVLVLEAIHMANIITG